MSDRKAKQLFEDVGLPRFVGFWLLYRPFNKDGRVVEVTACNGKTVDYVQRGQGYETTHQFKRGLYRWTGPFETAQDARRYREERKNEQKEG